MQPLSIFDRSGCATGIWWIRKRRTLWERERRTDRLMIRWRDCKNSACAADHRNEEDEDERKEKGKFFLHENGPRWEYLSDHWWKISIGRNAFSWFDYRDDFDSLVLRCWRKFWAVKRRKRRHDVICWQSISRSMTIKTHWRKSIDQGRQ